jgi:hypothetical protein
MLSAQQGSQPDLEFSGQRIGLVKNDMRHIMGRIEYDDTVHVKDISHETQQAQFGHPGAVRRQPGACPNQEIVGPGLRVDTAFAEPRSASCYAWKCPSLACLP